MLGGKPPHAVAGLITRTVYLLIQSHEDSLGNGRITRRQLRNEYGLRVGTWNIKTITGKEVEIVEEMKKYKIGILGVSELRKKGRGIQTLPGNYVLRYAGVSWDTRAKEGVGIIVTEETDQKVISWEAVNSRILWVNLELEVPVTFIQVYAPTEDSESTEKEAFFEELQRQIDIIEGTGRRVIVMGDLNGRVGNDSHKSGGVLGRYAGEDIVNNNGNRILDFCTTNQMIVGNTFYPHKRIHQITFESTQYASIIDYFIIPKDLKNSFTDIKVIRGAELSTDHHLLVADTIFRRAKPRKRISYQRIRWEGLKEEEKKVAYQDKLQEKLRAPTMGTDEVEEKWNTLKVAILESCEEVCGRKMVKEGVKSTKWWNDEVKAAVAEKKVAWKEWKRTRQQPKYEDYVQKRNNCKRIVKVAKKNSWEEFGESLERNFSQDSRQFWKVVRHMRGKFGRKVRSIKDKNNNLREDTEEVLEVWRTYYEDKFKDRRQRETETAGGRQMQENGKMNDDEAEPITLLEVQDAIKKMKNGKAAGEDNIVPEMVKAGGVVLAEEIKELFQTVWRLGKIPTDWQRNIIIPIYKKGDTALCENYRAICLINVIAKLYSRILERRLRTCIEEDLDEEQAGFRPGRQTQDLIFSLRCITDKWISRGKSAYLAFLDMHSAFDEVPRQELWKALEKKGTPPQLMQAIKSMFQRVEGAVRLNGKTSNIFVIEKGVRQGDSLSPLLFVAFMDEVVKTCKRRTESSVVGMLNLRPIKCQALIYADDIVLIADSERKLQQAVLEWTETLKEKGMMLNKVKSQVMVVTRTEQQVENIHIECDGEILTQVDSYQYLGTTVHQTGKLNEETRKRVDKATNAYYALSRCVFGKDEVSRKTKTRVYKAVIEPILTYGSESWTANRRDISRVNAVQMKCLRRVVGKTRRDRVRNSRVREELNVQPVERIIEDRQLSWFGHVRRMGQERKPRMYMEARAQGRRPIGRPRTTWEETVTQIAASRGKSMQQLRGLAGERENFKRWIRGHPPTPR